MDCCLQAVEASNLLINYGVPKNVFLYLLHVSYAVPTITQFQGQFRIGKCITNDISLCCHVKTSPD
jgi:hypothetical protein